jgi:hypothetical protein
MKKQRTRPLAVLVFLAAFLLVASTSLAAGIGKDGTIVAKKGKAKTIAELVEMYDSSSCIDCHEDAHNEWMESPHARPVFGTGRTASTFRTAFINGLQSWKYSGVKEIDDLEVEHLMGCAKCHLPQLADATDDVAKEFMTSIYGWYNAVLGGDSKTQAREEEKLVSLNINCLVCHNRMAITHKWTDGYPQAGVVYGSLEGAHDDEAYPEMKISPIMDESILCGQCHGLGPNLELDNPTQCATAYGSYLWAYTAEGGRKTCQECHMEESGLGHNMQSYRNPVMIEKALDFEVEANGVYWRDGNLFSPRAVVNVAMTNKTGHAIPDG